MTHNIRIACLGAGEGLAHAVHALLEHAVVPAENIILSRKDGPKIERFTASGCTLLDDDMNAIMRGELVLVVAPGDELDAVLAPVCGCTSGRYLIAVSDRAKLSDIVNRVARGTEVVAVCPVPDGAPIITYTQGFMEYIKPPCEDVIRAILSEKNTR
ncbi:MAG: hypothetical protein KHY89_09630 [Butyricicoccus pullicaecorum]|nr:hypothetical protein [Butyricicoccus pullicaecorum]